MVDRHAGWRKKLLPDKPKRPKTPIKLAAIQSGPDQSTPLRSTSKQPNQSAPSLSKYAGEDVSATDDLSDKISEKTIDSTLDKAIDKSIEPSGRFVFRRTFQSSRPQTPINAPPTPSGGEDTDDTRSEAGSEATSRGRNGPKPKLKRYISDYLVLTAPPKPEEFSEAWSQNYPFSFESQTKYNLHSIDLCLQGVRSHVMNNPLKPLGKDHFSGILHVFEDYQKVREEKERLDALLQETLEASKTAEASWEMAEGRYQDEIRRLELIIARSTSGMVGLMKARKGTIVGRRRTRKIPSTDRPERVDVSLTQGQLDEQIRSRSQKGKPSYANDSLIIVVDDMAVIFHRPSSPSGGMAALSRRFSSIGSTEELPIGTPPDGEPTITLTRKTQSELDLTKIANMLASNSQPLSVDSGFTISGDPLPDEIDTPVVPTVDPGVECEAFVALQELATLVARRRGINTDSFVSKLMSLYSSEADKADDENKSECSEQHVAKEDVSERVSASKGDDPLSSRRLRRFRSEPQLTADKNRRRHFSFEPGDDQLGVLNEQLREYEANRPKSPAGSQSTSSSAPDDPETDRLSERALSRTQTLDAEGAKPSKIPSPLNRPRMGSTRRENSTSSLRTVSSRYKHDNRRESRSSVQTAFRRDNSNMSMRGTQTTSRSNSYHDMLPGEGQAPGDFTGSLKRTNVAALAAARAASRSASGYKISGPARDTNLITADVFSTTQRRDGPWARSSENDAPGTRSSLT